MKTIKNFNHDDWRGFMQLCQLVKKRNQWQDFLKLMITPTERAALALRYVIVKELIQNKKTQRAIAREAHTSVAKITRGSNCLKNIDPTLYKFLEKYFQRK